jgi:dihydrolipoamide dehydrogenase
MSRIRAAQLGLKTACVESRETLGGTCLNVGCIPSKALLHASELFEEANHGTLAKWGVKVGKVELDLDAMHAGRLEAVKGLTGGIEFLFKKNKVTWLKGHAKFTGKGAIDVAGTAYKAKNFVIATGSSVTPLPGVNRPKRIIDSTGALELDKVPGHMVVVGGGGSGSSSARSGGGSARRSPSSSFSTRSSPAWTARSARKRTGCSRSRASTSAPDQGHQGRSRRGKHQATVEPAKGGAAGTIEADVVWSRSAAVPTPRVSTSTRPGSRSTSRARSRSTTTSAPVAGIYAIAT